MANEVVIKVEITLTVTPVMERIISELALAISKRERERQQEIEAELRRIAAAAKGMKA